MSLSGSEANLNVWKRESVEIFLLAQNFNSFLSQGTNWLHPHTNTCKIIKTNKYFQKFFLLFRLRSLVSMPFLWPPYLCNISALSLFSLVISYLVAFFCFRSTGSWTQDVAEDLYAQNWGCGGSFAQASKKPPCNQIKGPSLVWWNSVENPKIHYWLVKTLKSFISEISPRLCLFSSQEVADAKRLFLLSPKQHHMSDRHQVQHFYHQQILSTVGGIIFSIFSNTSCTEANTFPFWNISATTYQTYTKFKTSITK